MMPDTPKKSSWRTALKARFTPTRRNKRHVSHIDRFLSEFDQKHARSPAQQREWEKHQRIFDQRDRQSF